jgi:hypothetical protein
MSIPFGWREYELYLPHAHDTVELILENPCSQESNQLETSEAYV